jgi:hypothetical protein
LEDGVEVDDVEEEDEEEVVEVVEGVKSKAGSGAKPNPPAADKRLSKLSVSSCLFVRTVHKTKKKGEKRTRKRSKNEGEEVIEKERTMCTFVSSQSLFLSFGFRSRNGGRGSR